MPKKGKGDDAEKLTGAARFGRAKGSLKMGAYATPARQSHLAAVPPCVCSVAAARLIGRVRCAGLVGLPNVGKSSLFNLLTETGVAAENYPFCTIEPTEARCPVPDKRYDWLCELWKPASQIPAFLMVTDIAGLIKGASEGAGLGNAFLSTIGACDGIYHVVRAFVNEEILHVDETVDPVRIDLGRTVPARPVIPSYRTEKSPWRRCVTWR